MRKPSPGAVKRLFEGDLNRGEKVAGERGRSVAGAYVIIHNVLFIGLRLLCYGVYPSIVYHCDGKHIR